MWIFVQVDISMREQSLETCWSLKAKWYVLKFLIFNCPLLVYRNAINWFLYIDLVSTIHVKSFSSSRAFFFFLHSLGCFFTVYMCLIFFPLLVRWLGLLVPCYIKWWEWIFLFAILESICSTIKHDVSSRFFVDVLYHVEKVPFYL